MKSSRLAFSADVPRNVCLRERSNRPSARVALSANEIGGEGRGEVALCFKHYHNSNDRVPKAACRARHSVRAGHGLTDDGAHEVTRPTFAPLNMRTSVIRYIFRP